MFSRETGQWHETSMRKDFRSICDQTVVSCTFLKKEYLLENLILCTEIFLRNVQDVIFTLHLHLIFTNARQILMFNLQSSLHSNHSLLRFSPSNLNLILFSIRLFFLGHSQFTGLQGKGKIILHFSLPLPLTHAYGGIGVLMRRTDNSSFLAKRSMVC